MPRNDGAETLDTLFGGRLRIFQNAAGYRFSIDALLLAHFARPRPEDRVLELGTGCGVVSLILLFRRKARRVIGVEIQPSLCALARRNAAANRMASRLKVREKNWAGLDSPAYTGKFDLVLCNPPYRKVGSGRVNPVSEKARARHEIDSTLQDMLSAAQRLLKNLGRLAMIYPASRSAELIRQMTALGLEPKRMQWVHSREGEEARLVLVEGSKQAGSEVRVLPPLFIYDSEGKYTPAAGELFS